MNQRTTAMGGGVRVVLPYPNGWFAVCRSSDVRPDTVRTVPFMGQELIVYRTRSGRVFVVDPYCPHLGAHFGIGGKVVGEELVCPLHGFAFGSEGGCVRTHTGHKPPLLKLNHWRVLERNGLVLVWRDYQGRPPTWEVPEYDIQGYSPAQFFVRELQGYAHDVAENAADVEHFAYIHRFSETSMRSELDGPRMTTYLSARWLGIPLQMCLNLYGIGYVTVETTVPSLGLRTLTRGHATPTSPLRWRLWMSNNLKADRLAVLPAPLRDGLQGLLILVAHRFFMRLAHQDLRIWRSRTFITLPRLNAAEAPLAKFRRWLQQFYPDESLVSLPVSKSSPGPFLTA